MTHDEINESLEKIHQTLKAIEAQSADQKEFKSDAQEAIANAAWACLELYHQGLLD